MDKNRTVYTNPILKYDYSDPDVIRVGDDFYMVASSFNCVPGVPVLHSNDMINWEIINHVYDKLPFEKYDMPMHGSGAWAPSIRFHNGMYYVFIPMPDDGIFVSKTKDPRGEWSPLHCIKETVGWIDPCPFWDDDGNAYMIHAFAKSRCGINNILSLCRMDNDCTKLLDDGIIVFDGSVTQPTIEGPKLYKRNSYYYIFAPAGGVGQGWQSVLRSKNIYGPYEEKIVLHQGNTNTNGPHQGAWVELENGEGWFIHFQELLPAGRIVHLQPLWWEDDWPVMGDHSSGNEIGEPVSTYTVPFENQPNKYQTSDDFSGDRLSKQWQWCANPKSDWYEVGNGKLRLFAKNVYSGRMWDVPNVLSQKIPASAFTASAKIDCTSIDEGCKCGLSVSGRQYSYLAVEKADGKYWLVQYEGSENEKLDKAVHKELIPTGELVLGVQADSDYMCTFFYIDGTEKRLLGKPFKATADVWIGTKVGMFSVSEKETNGYADFKNFIIL